MKRAFMRHDRINSARPQYREVKKSGRRKSLSYTSPSVEAATLGANRVHEALCAPRTQSIGAFEVASSILPAHHVSGDFVVTFKQQDSWFVALGDLLGKGLSAAMWLTHALDLLRRACETDAHLGEIMGHLNREMHRSRVGVPLTALFLARFKEADTHLEYACGGCPGAFLLRAGRMVSVLDRGGPLLGALHNAKYESATIEFAPQDTLLAVSDGVIEIHHGVDFELRPDKVVHHLQLSHGNSATEIVESLTFGVQGQSLIDDISVLGIQRIR
jgi:serine phosphatase RsbU (regulator of sigma subunit)